MGWTVEYSNPETPKPRNPNSQAQHLNRNEKTMAVRHVVMWQLNGDTQEERQAKAVELAGALTELQYVVPGTGIWCWSLT